MPSLKSLPEADLVEDFKDCGLAKSAGELFGVPWPTIFVKAAKSIWKVTTSGFSSASLSAPKRVTESLFSLPVATPSVPSLHKFVSARVFSESDAELVPYSEEVRFFHSTFLSACADGRTQLGVKKEANLQHRQRWAGALQEGSEKRVDCSRIKLRHHNLGR